MVTFVLDTGALIAAERGDAWVMKFFALRHRGEALLIIPIVCLLEWWRGRTDLREQILTAVEIEPLTMVIAKAAGIAQAQVKGATPIDAAVMATAALRGAVVITRDVGDFARLREHFRSVRVLGRRSIRAAAAR